MTRHLRIKGVTVHSSILLVTALAAPESHPSPLWIVKLKRGQQRVSQMRFLFPSQLPRVLLSPGMEYPASARWPLHKQNHSRVGTLTSSSACVNGKQTLSFSQCSSSM